MEKDYLILKRASASRLSGEWNEDDFDVLAEGAAMVCSPSKRSMIMCPVGAAGNSGAWDEILVHQLDYRCRPCNFRRDYVARTARESRG
jgi:hypothetical protein